MRQKIGGWLCAILVIGYVVSVRADRADIMQFLRENNSYSFKQIELYFRAVPAPPQVKGFFNKITIEDAQLNHDAKEKPTRDSTVYTARVKVSGKPAGNAKIAVAGRGRYRTFLYEPDDQNWSISTLIPQLKYVDQFITGKRGLALSNFAYTESRFGIMVLKGANFLASLQLSGPLASVTDLVNKLKNVPGVTLSGAGDFKMRVVVDPQRVDKSSITGIIPMTIGIDKGLPKPFKSITTEALSLTIKQDASFTIGSGIDFGLTTQKEPLKIKTLVTTGPKMSSFMGYTKGLSMGPKWLQLKDVGILLEVDYAVSAATRIPITGVGASGAWTFGTGRDKVNMKIAGKAAVTVSQKITSMLLAGEVDNLKLSSLTSLFYYVTGQKVSTRGLPPIRIDKASVYIAPDDIFLAGTLYKQGVLVKGDMKVLGTTATGDILVNEKAKNIKGSGKVSDIDTPVFALKDVQYDIDISPRSVPKFIVKGMISIPPILLKRAVDINVTEKGAHTSFTDKIFSLSTTYELTMPTTRPRYFKGKCIIKLDGVSELSSLAKAAIGKIKDEVEDKIEKLKKEIEDKAKLLVPNDIF